MATEAYDTRLQETFANLERSNPVYSQIIERFLPLCLTQIRLKDTFAQQGFDLPGADPEKLGHGVSLLAQTGLPNCSDQLAKAFEELSPILKDSFPIAPDVEAIAAAMHKKDGLDMGELAEAFLENNAEYTRVRAEELGVSEGVLLFMLQCVLGPVLGAMAQTSEDALANVSWNHGHCPVCGGAPSIATLSKFHNTRDENLVGGGGKKHLTCSLCSHQWAYKRGVCPACDNDDSNKRELLFAEGKRHERIEACKKCGTYMLCVDLRELEHDPQSEVLPLGLVHLDIIAHQKNYAPLARMPWNNLG